MKSPLFILLLFTFVCQAGIVNFEWNANPPEENILHYRVEIRNSNGTLVSFQQTSNTTTKFDLPNGLYSAVVKARNWGGYGPASSELVFQVGTPNVNADIQYFNLGSNSWNSFNVSPQYSSDPRRFWRLNINGDNIALETSINLADWQTLQTFTSVGAESKDWRIVLTKP